MFQLFVFRFAGLRGAAVIGFALWAVFFGIKPLAEGSKEHEPADRCALPSGQLWPGARVASGSIPAFGWRVLLFLRLVCVKLPPGQSPTDQTKEQEPEEPSLEAGHESHVERSASQKTLAPNPSQRLDGLSFTLAGWPAAALGLNLHYSDLRELMLV